MGRGAELAAALVAVVLCGLGCGGSADDDDSSAAAVVEDCGRELPEPSQPCLAGCGNELLVGQPCSEGGGECTGNGFENAWLCTVDFDDTDLAFCTLPCVHHEDCGSEAFCTGDPDNPAAGAGCFPVSCWDGLPFYEILWTKASTVQP